MSDYNSFFAIIPQSILVLMAGALAHFLYRTLKFLLDKTYEEMITNHEKIMKKIEDMSVKLYAIERETYEIKTQLHSYVTVEKHYAYSKDVTKDITDVKEKMAKIESRI